MKLLIAVDMEGATGVTAWDHVDPKTAEYLRFRNLLTADVNAAVEGALAAGAGDILVVDGHWNSGNVLIEELNPKAQLITGTHLPLSMVEGVQGGADAALFVGYHARAGTLHAVLDHTWSDRRIINLWLNGRLAGETGLNGALCGAYGVPVLLVTGDQAVAAEARDWIPGLETAVVKTALGRTGAQCLPPAETGPLIHAAARRAVRRFLDKQGPSPVQMTRPVTVRIEFGNSQMVDAASLLPGSERLDGRTLEFTAGDMTSAYLQFRAAVSLAPTGS
ncbi:MAG: M55 family metallopeptidase [Holophaga sp.]|jgi:D-amino peptidase